MCKTCYRYLTHNHVLLSRLLETISTMDSDFNPSVTLEAAVGHKLLVFGTTFL